jgi:CheY-like chemotaxis protein
MDVQAIWLIDDDPMVNVFSAYLIEEYFPEIKTESFTFAGDAIRELDRFPKLKVLPDLIFLDISMPIINGWEFLDICLDRFPWIGKRSKIYILSASEQGADLEKAYAHPLVSGYLKKPLKQKFLLEVLRNPEVALLPGK